jgi:HEAT repeat protein
MKKIRMFIVLPALLCVAAVAVPASASTAEELLQQIASYEFGQSRVPLIVAENWVRMNLDSEQNRRGIAFALAGLLEGNATMDGKQFVCRQLAIIGAEENLPAIAPLLLDAKTADMARFAIQRMPGARVDAALLDALGKADAAAVPGMIGSLADRRAASAVKPLSTLATGEDAVVANCAIAALGAIGGPDAAKALGKLKGNVDPAHARAVSDAQLLVAEDLLATGDKDAAIKIYNALSSADEEAPVQTAAKLGLEAARM